MAEPTLSAATLGLSATVAGLTVASVLGIDDRTVLWALAGGFFGTSYAPRTGAVRAVVRYFFACALSALFASAVAKWWAITEPLYTWSIAGLMSFGFYPTFKAIVNATPEIVREGLRRFLGIESKSADRSDKSPGNGGSQ